MKILRKYPLLLLFAAFLFVTSVADMFVNSRAFSEMENRQLDQKPKLVLSELLKNEYAPKYETYVNDQFVGRDAWITMKSVSESALGKIENNGIIYGKNDRMFEDYRVLDERRFKLNLQFFTEFIEKYTDKTRITTAIIPNSYAVFPDEQPVGMQNLDQQALIAELYSALPDGAEKLDLFPTMEQAVADVAAGQGGFTSNEPVYYNTDHHWTTWGAYNAYRAFAASRGLKAVDAAALAPLAHSVSGFYGSYFSKCKLFSAKPDTIAWFDIPFNEITIDGEAKSGFYESEKWAKRDKHAAFLWGNKGLTVIKSDNNLNHADGKTTRILLFKDSYGNSLAPFLTYSYDEVYVVDLRSFVGSVQALMEETAFDDTLLLYNFKNFSEDSNILYLGR